MKRMKKLLAIILSVTVAMTMGISLASTAFAADGNEGDGKSITLTGGKAGHTYTLYQIFTGKVETKDGKTELTNIQWGTGASNAFKQDEDYPTAAAAAKAIAGKNDARATAQELVAKEYLGTGTPLTLTADGKVEFSGLEEGYYVIVDTVEEGSTVADEGDYFSAFIVEVVEDVTGSIKGSGATSDKEVIAKDGNGVEAAAYDIGDDVPFELTATTASNVAAYQKYHITFQDKQSEGLDAPEKFTVTVLGKTFTVSATGSDPDPLTTDNGTKITVTKAEPAEGYTFAIKVEFEPAPVGDEDAAKYLNAECNSKDIVVTYTSKLNDDAVVGIDGNTNDFHITYSNNPEDEDGSDEGKTPEDTVVVFTYKTVIDKVDASGNALAGAGFTIYKEVAEGTDGAIKGSEISFATTDVEHSAIEADKYYVVKAMTLVDDSTNQFEFEGLADGTYVLVETTIPDGFNPFNSVKFTISSSVQEPTSTDEDKDGITTLTGGAPFTTTNPNADEAVTAANGHKLDSGELYAEIENNSGAELPETGGIGTTIFYILGALLVIGCGIVLVARRRMTAK